MAPDQSATTSSTQTGVHLSSASHAAMSGDPIVCPECGKSSGPQSRFCGDCGVRLWEPCPSCGVASSVDRKFCGGCGESLSQLLQAQQQQLEQLLVDSEQLAEKGRFVEAIAMLDGASLVDHTRLQPLGDQVMKKQTELEKRREVAVSRMHTQLDEAKELSDGGRVRKALAKLMEIPEGLRNAEVRTLLGSVRPRVEQADQLRQQIKQGLKSKQYAGLAAAATKLSELEPDDQQVRQLAEQLSSKQTQIDQQTGVQLLQIACGALKQCDYGKAQQALAQMPAAELGKQHEEIHKGARERVWLATHLARVQYLDESSLKVAERFAKLQPQDAKAQALVHTLVKRRREQLKTNPGQPIVWRKTNANSPLLGAEVELAPPPAPLAVYAAAHGQSPEQLIVAYGLALQAIGEARYPLDLTPRKKSWLPLRGKKGKPPTGDAWGIDIGSSALKAVRLERGEDEQLAVAEVVCVPYARPGEDRRKAELVFGTPDYVTAALDKLFADRDFSGANVVTGVPGPWTLSRSFRLPVLDDAKFAEAVRYEARMRIPLDPDAVVFDQVVTELPHDDDLVQRAVTLVACAKSHIESLLARFQGRKLKSLQLTSEQVALLNVLQVIAPEANQEQATALVEIGAKATNLTVQHSAGCWFRGLYHGADAYDHLLVKGMQLGWEAAEKRRREPWRSQWMHESDQLLDSAMRELADALRRNFSQFENEQSVRVARVLVCGGGARQLGLMRRLTIGE